MPETARYEKSRVYLHVIGADADKEPPAFGYEVSPLVKVDPADDPFVSAVPGSDYALGTIEHGTRQEITVYRRAAGVGRQTQHAVAEDLRCGRRRHGFRREREGNFSTDAPGRAAVQNHLHFPGQTRPGIGPDRRACRQCCDYRTGGRQRRPLRAIARWRHWPPLADALGRENRTHPIAVRRLIVPGGSGSAARWHLAGHGHVDQGRPDLRIRSEDEKNHQHRLAAVGPIRCAR